MAKFVVRYWERTSIERVIEAEDETVAWQRMIDAVAGGKIDLSFAELEDSGATTRAATREDIDGIEQLEVE